MDRKERGGGKEKPFFCSIGEKLREEKEDGGNNFPLSPPFTSLPNWKEMEKERICTWSHMMMLFSLPSLL